MGGQPDANGHADTPSFSWGWRYASTLFRAYVVSLKHESRIWCLMMGGMKLHISCSSLSSQFPLHPRPPIPNQFDWQKRMCRIFTHPWNGQQILLSCFRDRAYVTEWIELYRFWLTIKIAPIFMLAKFAFSMSLGLWKCNALFDILPSSTRFVLVPKTP